MMIVEKNVVDIMIHIIGPIDKIDMVFDGEMMYGPMRSHILKVYDL